MLLDELLLRERTMRSLEPPTARNYLSFLRYLDQERPVAVSEETPYLNPRELVSVAAGQDNTWLEGVIEEVLFKFPLHWAQVRFWIKTRWHKLADNLPEDIY
jgi:hypothetical protein